MMSRSDVQTVSTLSSPRLGVKGSLRHTRFKSMNVDSLVNDERIIACRWTIRTGHNELDTPSEKTKNWNEVAN
jgi:hypothetical protein